MKAIYKDNNIKNESELEGEISFLSNRVDKKEELENKLKIFSDKSKEKEFTKCREAVEKIYEIKDSV